MTTHAQVAPEPANPTYRLLVTGARNWNRPHTIRDSFRFALNFLGNPHPTQITLVHGNAPGLDTLAAHLANRYGFHTEAHPANWDTHGKAAGPIRNQHMVDLGANLCLAYPIGDHTQSRGTYHCLTAAHKAGIPTYIITPTGPTRYNP